MIKDLMESIAAGTHGDPFAVLGPHEATRGLDVYAWLPQAESAALIVSGVPIEMKRVHPGGLFAAPAARRDYRLRLILFSGETQVIDDPYRFPPMLTPFELHLHGEGTNHESYRTLGAHVFTLEEVSGVRFAVWAPNAAVVSVMGDFNGWDRTRHPMRRRDGGIWEFFMPGLEAGATYKYSILSTTGAIQEKSDPYGFFAELPPKTASVVWPLNNHTWKDSTWMDGRASHNWLREPMSIYEVHLGSWLHGENDSLLTYRELADRLVAYVSRLGYTHIELMPVMEHPFTGSWGYQVSGYYAPTSRFGTPDDFRFFIDACHQAGIAVLLDWVPGHFPRDVHALGRFDGTALYEHADPRQGEHRDWGTLIFNYGRNEVRTFLHSNALYWLKEFHIDGLRVDAVASMLYLDYSREPGEWIPNRYGGRENIEAIDFIKRFNELTHEVPGAITMAEESTAWPGVSRPTYLDGLGFTMKWNMGWMHDMLDYFSTDPFYRKYHQKNITFSLLYAFSENFLLPVSHDEVVYGKGSLTSKMPGDEWRKFANTRAFLAYMYGHPGKKLVFMGAEFGQTSEWNHDKQLEWWLLQFPVHYKLQTMVTELNALYRREPALYEVDDDYRGFDWIDIRDVEQSIIIFARYAKDRGDFLVFCCNFTPMPRGGYRVGLPHAGRYKEVFNTDAEMFGGSNLGNGGAVQAEAIECHGRPASAVLMLPPLGVVVLKPER
ncbi:MAG: 1,4-alpha-glucan branching protein GlgB [Acidobacteriota bacterium]